MSYKKLEINDHIIGVEFDMFYEEDEVGTFCDIEVSEATLFYEGKERAIDYLELSCEHQQIIEDKLRDSDTIEGVLGQRQYEIDIAGGE